MHMHMHTHMRMHMHMHMHTHTPAVECGDHSLVGGVVRRRREGVGEGRE